MDTALKNYQHILIKNLRSTTILSESYVKGKIIIVGGVQNGKSKNEKLTKNTFTVSDNSGSVQVEVSGKFAVATSFLKVGDEVGLQGAVENSIDGIKIICNLNIAFAAVFVCSLRSGRFRFIDNINTETLGTVKTLQPKAGIKRSFNPANSLNFPKAKRTIQRYEYISLADLRIDKNNKVNTYGIVSFIKTTEPRKSKGIDFFTIFSICDESWRPGMGVMVMTFWSREEDCPVPKNGDIVRIHKAEVQEFNNQKQIVSPKRERVGCLIFDPCYVSVSDLEKAADSNHTVQIANKTIKNQIRHCSTDEFIFTDYDKTRITELLTFIRKTSFFEIELPCEKYGKVKLKDLRFPLPKKNKASIVCQLKEIYNPMKPQNRCCAFRIFDGTLPLKNCTVIPNCVIHGNINNTKENPRDAYITVLGGDVESIREKFSTGKWILLKDVYSAEIKSNRAYARHELFIDFSSNAITILPITDKDVKKCLNSMAENGTTFECNRQPCISAVDKMNESKACTETTHSSHQITQIRDVLENKQIPNKFRCKAVVKDYRPHDITGFTMIQCKHCDLNLSSEDHKTLKFCPTCKSEICYNYFFILTLMDQTGELEVIVTGKNAIKFFNGAEPKITYENEEEHDRMVKILALPLSGEHFLDFCVKSYYVDNKSSIRYQMFGTKLLLKLEY